jgi:hypothetical protein
MLVSFEGELGGEATKPDAVPFWARNQVNFRSEIRLSEVVTY